MMASGEFERHCSVTKQQTRVTGSPAFWSVTVDKKKQGVVLLGENTNVKRFGKKDLNIQGDLCTKI